MDSRTELVERLIQILGSGRLTGEPAVLRTCSPDFSLTKLDQCRLASTGRGQYVYLHGQASPRQP